MNEARLKVLEQFYEENPADPFNLYALALEQAKTDPAKAATLFDALLTDFEDYLPTYYQAIEFFVGQSQLEKALAIAEKGINKAKAAKELKTMGELRSLLEAIE